MLFIIPILRSSAKISTHHTDHEGVAVLDPARTLASPGSQSSCHGSPAWISQGLAPPGRADEPGKAKGFSISGPGVCDMIVDLEHFCYIYKYILTYSGFSRRPAFSPITSRRLGSLGSAFHKSNLRSAVDGASLDTLSLITRSEKKHW